MDEQANPAKCGSQQAEVAWSQAVSDATAMLSAEEVLTAGLAQVCERPFDPQARAVLVQLLTHPRWAAADAAAHRMVIHHDEDEQ